MRNSIRSYRPRLKWFVACTVFACTAAIASEWKWFHDRSEKIDGIERAYRTDSAPIVTRVYDARDLIISIPDFDTAPDFEISQGNSPTSNGGQVLFGGGNTFPSTRTELVQWLIADLRRGVGKNSWKDSGGSIGAIRELGGQMIVTHTPSAQRQITLRLESLRLSRKLNQMMWHWGGILLMALTVLLFVDLALQLKRRSLRLARGQCLSCGYDLRGSLNRCPECGQTFTPPATATLPAVV